MEGLLRKTVVSGAMSEAQERKTPAAVPTAVGVQKTEAWIGPPKKHYRKYIATREISIPTGRGAGFALFAMCYVDAHAAIMESTCTKLSGGHGSQEVFEGL